MPLKELLEALGKLQDGQKYVDALNAIIATKDGDLTKAKNDLKTTKAAVKESETKLKTATERLGKLQDHLGIEDDIEDLDTALTELATAKPKGADEKLLKRLQKLENDRKKDKADADALLATERGKRHDAMKNQAIISALTAGKAIKPEKLIALLQNSVKVNDDDTLTFTDENGSEIAINDGVAAWLKANPEFVSNTQTPGGGSAGGNGSTGGNNDFAKNLAAENSKGVEASSKGQEIYFG
ncbi:hypothetical protein [Pelosinus sp. sgz500959]|uniref:hypothetical protein n=1 Tax=Pelosinus sp. sgz500959 TaxID=3242472 RepID=UPI00366A753E